jgi:hypothetical protein
MKVHSLSSTALFALASLLSAHAQTRATSAVYEISSGEYVECCGIAGEKRVLLPNSAQRFVKLTTNAQSQIVSMSILGDDMQTVFSITPLCPPSQGPVPFSFDGGFVFQDRIIFHVDPGLNGLYWNYTVSNSPARLTINGLVGLALADCADVPDKFTHTNVVATLVAQPSVEFRAYTQDGPALVVHGRAGWQTVVEASSDLQTWVEIARDIMPASVCPTCPELEVHDTGAGGIKARFYRSYQRP